MKRRMQINLLKLFSVIILFISIILITRKEYLPINNEMSHLKNVKKGLLTEINRKQNLQKFYEITLPNFRHIKEIGFFINPSHEGFKHQLRHILDNYNISVSVRFYDSFYDKIFPDFDLSFLPVNINFFVYEEDSVYQLIHDINQKISYLISPLQLNIKKSNDRYIVDYMVFWIKGLPYGGLSNLASVESPWHYAES